MKPGDGDLGYIDDVTAELAWLHLTAEDLDQMELEADALDADAEIAEEGDAVASEPGAIFAADPVHNPLRHVGRNDPCPCGSGKKFKKCCLGK